MEKEVIIIGGGIIGVCSAYYLSQAGHKVTILDRGKIFDGCSFGNAGMIVPSHIVPLAAPGMISQGMRWMLSSKSPFYVRPRLNVELLSWGRKFYRASNQKHVDRSMPSLLELSLLSKSLYQELAKDSSAMAYEEKGLLMLFQSEKVGQEEVHAGKIAQSFGLEVNYLSKAEVQRLESGTYVNALGGVHYKSDAHLYPSKLMHYLISECKRNGVQFLEDTEVLDLQTSGSTIAGIQTNNGNFSADEYVIAGGTWSPFLSKKLGINISLLPGKGYSFTFENPISRPTYPSILCEGKVAVTPMGNDLRFGGTMEITHVNDTAINQKRLQGIVETANSFYPDLSIPFPKRDNQWYGFRPCSPDGLPYIGRSQKITNATIATGHAMMGLSLAPATGFIVNALISNQPTPISIDLFHPDRRL